MWAFKGIKVVIKETNLEIFKIGLKNYQPPDPDVSKLIRIPAVTPQEKFPSDNPIEGPK